MNKEEKLKNIHKKWFEKCECELKKTATQPVPGDGSADAEIIFIGEAPGRSEDQQGRPFVGPAGKFLAEMLSEINLKREEIYISRASVSIRQSLTHRPCNEIHPSGRLCQTLKNDWI